MSAPAHLRLVTRGPTWDDRVDVLAAEAAAPARAAAEAALARGATPQNILDAMSAAIDAFTATHTESAYGHPANREDGRRQRFDDLYRALRAGEVPRAAHRPIECLIEHAVAHGPLADGWRPDLYLEMARWLVAPEPSIPKLLDVVAEAADHLVHWQATDDLEAGADDEGPCSPEAAHAADAFISALYEAGGAA